MKEASDDVLLPAIRGKGGVEDGAEAGRQGLCRRVHWHRGDRHWHPAREGKRLILVGKRRQHTEEQRAQEGGDGQSDRALVGAQER